MINNIFLKNFFLKWASLTLFKVLGGDINKKNPPTFVRCSVNCAFTIFQFLVHWKTSCQAWSILLVFFSDIQFQSHPVLWTPFSEFYGKLVKKYLGGFHKPRRHEGGEEGSAKCLCMSTWGGGGGQSTVYVDNIIPF